MFRRKPQWLRCNDAIINLSEIVAIVEDEEGMSVLFKNEHRTYFNNISLDEIHYALKHGKLPHKREK